MPEAWKNFKQYVNMIFTGPLKEKADEKKGSYLLLWVGDKDRDIYNIFPAVFAEEKKKLKPHLENLKDTCNQIKTPQYLPDINLTMKYRDPVCLISLLQSFQYWPGTVISEEMIRDRIVFGIQSEKIREKLINVGNKRTLDDSLIR